MSPVPGSPAESPPPPPPTPGADSHPDGSRPAPPSGTTAVLRERLLREGLLLDAEDESAQRSACARCGRPCPIGSAAGALPLCERCAPAARAVAGAPGRAADTEPAHPDTASGIPPDACFGRYRIVRELGRGGMGIVYQAEDPELRRTVALKILRQRDDPEMTERFLREARMSATLDHPGIVPIHEVNIHAGTPYYVMAFVEGSTLGEAIARGAWAGMRERARLVLESAEAVAHAHARRVIHRDLKPSNILIDPAGHAHVVDFGLAKQMDDATRLTSTGVLLGTPHYMSPEQLRGQVDAMGPPSDVYALGVVLYEAMTGKPPFEGRSAAEVIANALAHEPESPRRRDTRVPLDLETIVLKSLAKEPARRYPTAREFADEVGRFLRGEAIAARREGLAERAWRWLRRRPALVAAVAVAALAVTLAVGSEWESVRRRHEQERVEGEFVAYLRSIASTNLAATLSLRRAGVGGDLAATFLVRLEEAAREADRRAPTLAEPGYHLGRMYRALLRFDDALREQERALARDPDFAPSLYERGILRARQYRARLATVREQWARTEGKRLADSGALERAGLGAQALPEPPLGRVLAERDGEAAALRRAILADLERLERRIGKDGSQPAPPGTSPGMVPCARGLFLLYGGRPEERAEANRLLEAAHALDPLLEEAVEGIAGARIEEGKYAEAEAAFTRGLATDRGYLPFRLGRGDMRYRRGEQENRSGVDPLPAWQGAVEDFTQALTDAPGSAAARLGRARALAALADRLGDSGEDTEARFLAAIDDLAAAIELDATRADAWRTRGHVQAMLGYQRADRGGDPSVWYGRAEADFDAAVRLDAASAEAHRGRADLHRYWALFAKSRGEDPTTHYQTALADYSRSLALDPLDRLSWRRRGAIRFSWANWRKSRGESVIALFDEAEADYARALEGAPEDPGLWTDLGQLRLYRGAMRAEAGADPSADYQGALACYDRALAGNPGSAGAWHAHASVHLWRARQAQELGEDPEPRLIEAETDLARALAIAPRSYDLLATRAQIHDLRARAQVRAGADPRPAFAAALADARAALEFNPRAVEGWMQQGVTQGRRAAWRAEQGEAADAEFAVARAHLERALALNPEWDRVWLARARVALDEGIARLRRGDDPAAPFAAAAADLAQACERNAGLAMTWCTSAELRRHQARGSVARGEDPAELLRQAQAALDRAMQLAPEWAEVHAERARLRQAAGDPVGARADAAEAVRRAPLRAEYGELQRGMK